MSFGVLTAYRADIIIWTLVEAAVPLVSLAVWFSASSQNTLALSNTQVVTYFILVFFVSLITRSWVSFFLTQEILDGSIAKYLIKPFTVFWEHIADNITVKIPRLIIPGVALVFALYLFPQIFAPEIFNISRALLFLISIALASVLAFVFDAIFASLAFWIEDAFQIVAFQNVLSHIGSGALIPFALMPNWLFAALYWLPFRYMLSAPIEILMNTEHGQSAALLIQIQCLWIAVSLTILVFTWRRGVKRYVVPGQ